MLEDVIAYTTCLKIMAFSILVCCACSVGCTPCLGTVVRAEIRAALEQKTLSFPSFSFPPSFLFLFTLFPFFLSLFSGR